VSPETVGHYRLEAPLGESGHGVVYRALASDASRAVALKVVPPEKFKDAAARRKFLADARAAARLAHPHLRKIHEAGESGDKIFLAMELLEGVTLKSVLLSGRVEPETALEWAAEVAEALAAVHAAGLVHGDVRPSRVFITSHGTVKLLEPALWRVAGPARFDPKQKESDLRPDEAAALSPEQLQGRPPDARSDLFALGSILYEMVAGKHPFVGRNVLHTLTLIERRAPEPLGSVALDAVLARALEKDPKRRFASAAELAEALRLVAEGKEPAAAPPPAVRVRWTAPLWWGIGILVAVAVTWFGILALTRP